MRVRIFVMCFIVLMCAFHCSEKTSTREAEDLIQFVNPFIGTDDMGHTFPGAAVPFGLVALSPDTDSLLYSYGDGYNPEIYRYCAGYQYKDKTIVGFSHTHFNGTGHSDLGDFLVMPMIGQVRLNSGTEDNPESGYRSGFSHEREEAHPGYYAVHLDDYKIDVELTATERVGFHKYRFPQSDEVHIILDLTSGIYNYDGKVVWSSVRVENDTLITGFRQTHGWARERYLYFAMALSKPMKTFGLYNDETLTYRGFWRKWNESDNFPERAGRRVKAHFDFETDEDEEILVKFALSAVCPKNAVENLKAEITHWDFEAVHKSAQEKWNRELSRIVIKAPEERKVNFYTSMYHSFLNPVVYNDVNGQYRGLDQNIHHTDGFTNYTIFSLWDTYRALHPLFTLVQQERTNDIVRSMLAHYDESVHHILPIWSHHGNENWCMIGYHAVPVIADAYMKGLRVYDNQKAFDAVIASANYDPYDGIGDYKQYGYVPEDLNRNSASKTLEYAYDDWTIYRFAVEVGESSIAEDFKKRALSYKNLYDEETGFMRARLSDGSWKKDFDPLSVAGQGFIEGNAWNYSLYVPHDIQGFIRLLGGEDRLVTWLDSLFVMSVSDEDIAHSEDVTRSGMIGNYVHGNEPSHHVPYMYVYAGKPWKTQERVHQIVNTMYRNEVDGLCGNDDCGQMSAWYIFSCLGFYPVCPGSNEYVIGSPCVDEAILHLENGKTFKVVANQLSDENIYVQSALLNGKAYNKCFIVHDAIVRGGELMFEMGPEPNKTWGSGPESRPYSMSQ